MKAIICVLLLVAVFAKHPVNQEIVDEIKRSTKLWYPVEVEENIFRFHTEEALKGIMGSHIDTEKDVAAALELGLTGFTDESYEALPENFDSTTHWPQCPFDIKNQGSCGSCWAFGAVEAFEDRLCIKSDGQFTADLSEQVVVSCDKVGFGCGGGFPLSAFSYLTLFGTTTEECVPYESGETTKTGTCHRKCTTAGADDTKYKCKYPWMSFTETGIKAEIYKNGPVETAFTVYSDFMNYGGGIYEHKTGSLEGGHAVKIVGWGVEEGKIFSIF